MARQPGRSSRDLKVSGQQAPTATLSLFCSAVCIWFPKIIRNAMLRTNYNC